MAGRGAAGQVGGLAVRAGELLGAAAVEGAHLVDADAPVAAGRGRLGALVDVLLAGLPVEGGGAGADVVGVEGGALAPVGAGVGGAGVGQLAGLTWRPHQNE